jgi:hypothetical protein
MKKKLNVYQIEVVNTASDVTFFVYIKGETLTDARQKCLAKFREPVYKQTGN